MSDEGGERGGQEVADSWRSSEEVAPEDQPTSPPATSGLAIGSLVCGILGFLCSPVAIAGLILGIVALTSIRNSKGTLKGNGLAVAGIVVSAVMVVLHLVSLATMIVSRSV